MKRYLPHRHGFFTLIELLVVIAIIAILTGMLLPSLAGVKATGKKIQCLNNIKQLGLTVIAYANSNNDFFPIIWNTAGNGTWQPMAISDGVENEKSQTYLSYLNGGGGGLPKNIYNLATARAGKAGIFRCPATTDKLWKAYKNNYLINYGINNNAILKQWKNHGINKMSTQKKPSMTSLLAETWGRFDEYHLKNASLIPITESTIIKQDGTLDRRYTSYVGYRHPSFSASFYFMDGHGAVLQAKGLQEGQIGNIEPSYLNSIFEHGNYALPPANTDKRGTWHNM